MTQRLDIGHRLLIPLDGSALATLTLLRAAALARPDAHIILLRAVPAAAENEPASPRDAATRTALATARQYLEDVAEHLYMSAPDLSVEVVVAAGDPVTEIVSAVHRLDVDAVVMASLGQGGIGRWTFGSVAGRVVHKVDVPVLVVRPDDQTRNGDGSFRRLVVPLDGSPRAGQSLSIARSLARRLSIPVTLIAVLDPVQAGLPDNGAATLASEQWQEVRLHAQVRAQQALSQAATSLTGAGIKVSTELVEGPVVDCLRAAAHPDDLIVLTSRTRESGLAWEEESVAKRVIRAVPVPILLIRAQTPADIMVPVSEELEPVRRTR